MSQIQHFRDFIFKDQQAFEKICSVTHDSQSFANEISRMKISRKASWLRKPWKLHPLKICTYCMCDLLSQSQSHMWNYWRVEYLVMCSKNAVGETFIWQFWVLYRKKPNHAYSLNGVHLIWQYLHDSPNC